jgi:hypothetical protein
VQLDRPYDAPTSEFDALKEASMTRVNHRLKRGVAIAGLSLFLAACGGGGGDAPPVQSKEAPPADARNGTYTAVAADAREYSLALDFDAKTYHVTGNGIDTSGAISEQSGVFSFAPGNASGTTGSSTTRFTLATDSVVGELPLAGGTVPFLAARNFAGALADTVGTYNMLGRTVDTAAGTADTTIQQGEITAGGQLRLCADLGIYEIANCPSTSVSSGTITVSGNLFTAATPAGNILYRVANVGTDKVFLRASASVGTTRRFMVGTPATATFSGDAFLGATTEPAWGTVTLTTTSFASSGTSPAGATSSRSGAAVAVGTPTPGSIPGIRFIDAGAAGYYFAIRSSEVGVVVSSFGSSAAPGFMAIGRKQ